MKIYALIDIEILLQSSGWSLTDFPTMPLPNISLLIESQNKLLEEELNYDIESLADEHVRLMLTMTKEQRRIYDKIMDKINEKSMAYFLFMVMVEQERYLFRGSCLHH